MKPNWELFYYLYQSESDNEDELGGWQYSHVDWSISPGVSGVPNVDACVVQEQTREGGKWGSTNNPSVDN